MNAFRLFRPAFSTATRALRTGPSTRAWQQAYRPPVRRSLHTFFTPNSSRRACTQWQTCFRQARSNAQQQQKRAYRRQLFNRNNIRATGTLFRRWSQRPTFYYEAGGLAGVVGIFYISNVETVPVSGRRRFNVISDANEKWLGQMTLDQLLQEYQGQILPESSREHRMAVRVMERLIPHCGLEGQEWEVRVIDDRGQKNAFVLPGGKVFVFSGILEVTKDEDGLAAVLGHEIAHNVAHHAAEQASRSILLLPVGIAAFLAAGIDPSILRFITNLLFALPGSRKQEEEADYIGLLMMSESCYDPKAAMRLWSAMEKEENGQAPPQFMSTHPSNHNRLEKIQSWLSEAEDKFEQSDCAVTASHMGGFRQAVEFPRW